MWGQLAPSQLDPKQELAEKSCASAMDIMVGRLNDGKLKVLHHQGGKHLISKQWMSKLLNIQKE